MKKSVHKKRKRSNKRKQKADEKLRDGLDESALVSAFRDATGCQLMCVKVTVRTNLDLIRPSEAFELPKPHVFRLHPPLPAGGTLLRALPCQHHDQPATDTLLDSSSSSEHFQNPEIFEHFSFHLKTFVQPNQ